MRFSTQVSSTWVRLSDAWAIGTGPPRTRGAALPVMMGLQGSREFAREQLAQTFGDGDPALERGDLDPAAQVRRHVDGEPRGETGGVAIAPRGVSRLDPVFGIGRPGGEAATDRALAHRAVLPRRNRSISSASAAISRAAGIASSSSQTRRPDCAATAKAMRWPMVVASTGGS